MLEFIHTPVVTICLVTCLHELFQPNNVAWCNWIGIKLVGITQVHWSLQFYIR